MSDSEEDYMSDAFLAKCQDKRPGLVTNQHKAKVLEKEKKNKDVQSRIKPKKVLEQEKRTEGLNTAIGEDNKGFALMQKMGYKPGMSLGKKGTGRVEPVSVNLKTGRGGLGEEAEKKRKQEEMSIVCAIMQQKRQKRAAVAQSDFRSHNIQQMATKKAERDLYMSQRVCEQLDEEQGLESPAELFFWTAAKLQVIKDREDEQKRISEGDVSEHSDEEEEEEEEVERVLEEEERVLEQPVLFTLMEQLEMLTRYLRREYLYCVWCGTKYEGEEDMTENCPGSTAEDHDS